jgi:hypothetical protein
MKAARNNPYKELHHPRYTPLHKVPDSAILEVGLKRFADSTEDVAWPEAKKDQSARSLEHKAAKFLASRLKPLIGMKRAAWEKMALLPMPSPWRRLISSLILQQSLPVGLSADDSEDGCSESASARGLKQAYSWP